MATIELLLSLLELWLWLGPSLSQLLPWPWSSSPVVVISGQGWVHWVHSVGLRWGSVVGPGEATKKQWKKLHIALVLNILMALMCIDQI